ncbi:MAG: 3-deoxy-7-phosphoheptulonate synthase [Dehalococcoidales bacterium]|nr:3-deoxy-7-phosphoheptulonate synthase [Dehalococcoidales bacterium]
MIIVMRKDASKEQIEAVTAEVQRLGFRPHLSIGEERTIIGVIGDERPLTAEVGTPFEILPGVERTVPILQPFKLASRDFREQNTLVDLGGVAFGGQDIVVIAGPCSVESREQLWQAAAAVKKAGGKVLRGGAFKPRTSPYSFQGLGKEGLEMLAEVKQEMGLRVVTEVMSPYDLDLICQYADMLQVGTRNMQNYALLKEVGLSGRPVMLKRGFANTIQELLLAAEYVLAQQNYNVILCERGIRTFETATRFTLDINAIPVLKQLTHLPVIADPGHATGKWNLVGPVAKAAIAAGADGVMVEVHPYPERALCDGPQSLKPEAFSQLMGDLRSVAAAVGRTLP